MLNTPSEKVGSYEALELYLILIHCNANDNIREDKNKCQWKFLAEILLSLSPVPCGDHLLLITNVPLFLLTFHIPNSNMLFVYLDIHDPLLWSSLPLYSENSEIQIGWFGFRHWRLNPDLVGHFWNYYINSEKTSTYK